MLSIRNHFKPIKLPRRSACEIPQAACSARIPMDVQVKKPSAREIEDMAGWPVWEKEPSSFDWSYSDRETCYFLEGDVEVELPDGNSVRIQKGDVAVFPQGLNCRWVVRSKVRKHYKFG